MGLHIRDPIYGFIELNELEGKLIQTYPFQRLRFIHQLGTTFWVYPTGVHTRFEHSLGVLQLAARVLRRLKFLNLEIKEEDEKIFRVAALLHDIGHAPFSHVGEEMGLFEKGLNHERMGEKIIKETEIKDIILKYLGQEALERIVFIIRGEGKPFSYIDNLFHNILAGQAGIDRMDYLLRDSYFLGVMYGRFDIERILETIEYNDERYNLYWEEGGLHALEQFILARYFMFTEVYFHKTRRILDFHLSGLIKEYLKKKKKYQCFPSNVDEYLKLNDNAILNWMLSSKNYKKIFLERKFFRKVEAESSDHPDEAEILLWAWLEDELNRNFDASDFYVDKAENVSYKFEKPEEIYVSNERGVIMPLSKVSKLVEALKPIRKIRVYASDRVREKMNIFIKEFLKEKGGKKI